MAKPLRQSIEIPLGEETVSIDVTFRILEIVERRYEARADFVPVFLQDERFIKRTEIAAVIADWCGIAGLERPRGDIYEAVITAPERDLRRYVGSIQGAVYYSLKEITAEELASLSRGEDLKRSDDGGRYVEVETDDDDPQKKSESG